MPENFERKTLDQFTNDLNALNRLDAPAIQPLNGSDADREYRVESKLAYALDMIGHLLKRIEHLEATRDNGDGIGPDGFYRSTLDNDD